jgi:hemoglobin
MIFLKWLSIIFVTVALLACSHVGLNSNPFYSKKQDTLFQRIGGLPVLTEIVDQFIDEVATSPRTKRSFDGIKLKALKESVVAQLCHLTGGGCVYEGETMLNSHRDAKITEAEFDAFVDMFRNTLNRYLPTKEKNELLKILAPMKRDIVTK